MQSEISQKYFSSVVAQEVNDNAGDLDTNTSTTFQPNGNFCPLCNKNSFISRTVRAHDTRDFDEMSILQCASCDFAWQWPLKRDGEASVEYFRDNYNNPREGSYFDKPQKREICTLELEFIRSVTGKKGSLLDIGSGDGTFAEIAFANGWDVCGVDPAGPNRDETIDGKRLRLFKGRLTDLEERSVFDVITMWDVVEHLERPLDLIVQCRHHLAPGGWLVLETGNFQSTGRIIDGPEWWCYQHDHRWYFTPQSLQALLERAGFDRFHLCGRTLRPWVNADGTYEGPSAASYFRASLKRPWRSVKTINEFMRLKDLWHRYPRTANLQIFTLAAQMTA